MLFPILLFILGIHVGSFLNVCIWRMPRGESVAHPPSHCPSCNNKLRFLDLIPLLSQLLLRGKCRYCGARFSWRYFGIELLTGVLFMLCGLQQRYLDPNWLAWFGTDGMLSLLRDLVFMATLVVIFWIDYDTRLIQLEAVLLLGLAGICFDGYQIWRMGQPVAPPLSNGTLWAGVDILPAALPQSILAMVLTSSFLWGVREFFSWIYGREALGFGDVMLVAAIAANLGWNSTLFTFFFLAVVVGALVGVLLQTPRAICAYRWGKNRRLRYPSAAPLAWPLARRAFRKAMPFGPMLAIGAVIALLYGEGLNRAYVNWVNPPENPRAGPAYAVRWAR